MKIRTGFVSNSSSSSFVVAFDKKPKTMAALKKLLFGDVENFANPYPHDDTPATYPTKMVAETIWTDLQKSGPLTPDAIIKEFASGWIAGAPDHDYNFEYKNKLNEAEVEVYRAYQERQTLEYATKTAVEFMEANKGKIFFLLSYADENGTYYSALEHGDVFERLPHFVISHH